MLDNTHATVLTCLHGSLSQVYPDHVSLVRGVQLVPPALLPGTWLPAWSAHPEHRSGEVQMVLFQIQIFIQMIIFPFSDGLGMHCSGFYLILQAGAPLTRPRGRATWAARWCRRAQSPCWGPCSGWGWPPPPRPCWCPPPQRPQGRGWSGDT